MADSLIATEADAASPRSPRPIAVVVNGKAGALLDRADVAEAFTNIFAEAGLEPNFVPQDAGSLPERIELARTMGHPMVVVAGGDGTVALAAQALVGSDTALGILPYGTMNLIAKDLGIPIGDDAAAIRVLAEGVPRAIDVGEVNGHVFLCGSMLGLPTRLARYREAQRGHGGLGAHIAGYFKMARVGLRYLRHYVPRRFVLRAGDDTVTVRSPSVTITVNLVDDASSHLFARSRLDGGELGLYLIDRITVPDLLRLSWHFLRGGWRHDPALRERRVKEIEISARRRRIRVMNDGEVMVLHSPLRYRIRPKALRVLAPTPPSPAAPPAVGPSAAASAAAEREER